MIRSGPLALTALLASPAAVQGDPGWPAGIYSSVTMSEGSGDLGGVELRFFDKGDRRMVEFVWCQGWCNEANVAEVKPGPDGYVFTYAPAYTKVPYRFALRRVGRDFDLTIRSENENESLFGKPERLRRIPKSFGLAAAQGEQK